MKESFYLDICVVHPTATQRVEWPVMDGWPSVTGRYKCQPELLPTGREVVAGWLWLAGRGRVGVDAKAAVKSKENGFHLDRSLTLSLVEKEKIKFYCIFLLPFLPAFSCRRMVPAARWICALLLTEAKALLLISGYCQFMSCLLLFAPRTVATRGR